MLMAIDTMGRAFVVAARHKKALLGSAVPAPLGQHLRLLLFRFRP